jgi:steroid delta-isomerase-like uncharacterized protein
MSTEEKKALVRRSIDLINQKDFAAVDQIYASSYVRHDPNAPQVCSREDYKQYVSLLCNIFPDLHFTLEDLVAAEEDKVVFRFKTRGTHSSPWRGMPATGKQVGSTGIAISRVVEGKIVEDWFINDVASLAQQIGGIPASPPTPTRR